MSWDVSERDVQRWGRELERVCERMASRFGRVEVQRRAPFYVRGLIAQVDRKNGWQLADSQFRRCGEQLGLGYVVAISSSTHLFLNGRRTKVSEHLSHVPEGAWSRLSCGSGTKGERFYDWALVAWPSPENEGFERGWLMRRSISDPTDIASYFTHAPHGTALEKIVPIAGRRWTIEECFEQAKQLTGLNEYEVRSWIGWHRHITLSLLALAMLVVIRTQPRSRSRRKKGADLIPLTVPEVRTLLVTLVLRRTALPETVLGFSEWRRHHQLIAKHGHDKARGSPLKEVEL